MDTKDPYVAKSTGKSMSSPTWSLHAEGALRALLKVKYIQNPDLRAVLLATGNDTLVEATIDPYWGSGCSIDSKALERKTYTGWNIAGALLQEIRAEILATFPDEQTTPGGITLS